jgi:hypothetical protein
MGMHFGVVATTGSATDLLSGLAGYGSFEAGRAIDALDEAPERDTAGERVLVAGDLDGRAYLLDPGLLVSTGVDLIVDASRRLDRRVMAISAETTSGTYVLMAAVQGRLERLHWNLLGGQTEPYDVGPPLAGEPSDGLDDVDGRRLFAVLEAAGFDVERWRDHGRKVIVETRYGAPVTGPAGEALAAFMATHLRPDAAKLKPVVARRGDGFDLVAAGSRLPDGSRIGEPRGERGKRGVLGRLFDRG